MENIFENSYFGKAYKTRDGRKALYIQYDNVMDKHCFLPEDGRFTYCFNDGMVFESETCVDIISEWQEEINEEELHKLALEYVDNDDTLHPGCAAFCAYKAGYRKAKEGSEK